MAIVDPLQDAFRKIRDGLKARVQGYHSDLNSYWNTVLVTMQGSDQTMRAALFLVGDKRIDEEAAGDGPGPFPAQAVILQRGLIEGLANVLALSEDRIRRDLVFRKDGYRESAREQISLRKKLAAGTLRQRKNSQWKAALDDTDRWLAGIAKSLRLTAAETADPEGLPSWCYVASPMAGIRCSRCRIGGGGSVSRWAPLEGSGGVGRPGHVVS